MANLLPIISRMIKSSDYDQIDEAYRMLEENRDPKLFMGLMNYRMLSDN